MGREKIHSRYRVNPQHALLFVLILLYKMTFDFAFVFVLCKRLKIYTLSVNPIAHVIAGIVSLLIFFLVPCDNTRASTHLMMLFYIMQILPMGSLVGLVEASPLFFYACCLFFSMTVMIVRSSKHIPIAIQLRKDDLQGVCYRILRSQFTILLLIVFIAIVATNGPPSLIALNIFNVYALRRSGSFVLNKYLMYLFTDIIYCILPVFLTVAITKHKPLASILCICLQVLLYLYSGHKIVLFGILLCLFTCITLRMKNPLLNFYCILLTGLVLCSLGVLLVRDYEGQGSIYRIYSLLIRRAIVVPAHLKYVHYDYFSKRPFMGLYGLFPRAIVGQHPYYSQLGVTYPFDIGRIYFESPSMSADTGAIAEGYMRFGYLGLFLVFFVIALFLWLIDGLQIRAGYAAAVAIGIFPTYSLSEGKLISALFLGYWLLIFMFILLYKPVITKWQISRRSMAVVAE